MTLTTVILVLKYILALAMVSVGVLHFTNPKPFVRIMPSWLPAHLALVYVSGFFEIAGGLGLLFDFSQRLAAWGLIALFIAVLPANINMAINDIPLGKKKLSKTALWARIPMQLVLMAWAYLYT